MMCNFEIRAMRLLEPRSKTAHPLKDRTIDSQYRFDNGNGTFPIVFKKYAEGVVPNSNLKRTRPEVVKEKRANLQRIVTGVPTRSCGNFEEIYGGLNKWFFPEEVRPLVSNWYGPWN